MNAERIYELHTTIARVPQNSFLRRKRHILHLGVTRMPQAPQNRSVGLVGGICDAFSLPSSIAFRTTLLIQIGQGTRLCI